MKPIKKVQYLLLSLVMISTFVHAGLSLKQVEKSAKKGDVISQMILADKYYEGVDTAQDYKKALYWYEKAAKSGDKQAQLKAGTIYLRGFGVKKDEKNAANYLKQAAVSGQREAQFLYAQCLENGTGVSKDMNEAYIWYRKSAGAGYVSAVEVVSRKDFFEKLEKALGERYATSSDFSKLTGFRNYTGYKGLSVSDRQIAEGKVKIFVQQNAPNILRSEFRNEVGLVGMSNLLAWEDRKRLIAQYLSSPDVQSLKDEANINISQISDGITQEQRQAFAEEVLKSGVSLSALKKSIDFEINLKAKMGNLYLRSEFDDIKAERKSHRQTMYSKLSNTLVNSARSVNYISELNDIESEYFMESDKDLPSVSSILSEFSKVRDKYTPFRNIPGGDYYNALYGGDWELLSKYDSDYMRPYIKGVFGQTMAAYGALYDGLMSLAGAKTNAAQMIMDELESASLVTPILSSYLVNYDSAYSRCLRADAVQFKKTVTSETVYKNGFGVRKYSVRNPDQISYFTVNREFSDIFEKVGLNTTDSGSAQMLEAFFNPRTSSKSNLSGVVEGATYIMNNFKCDDPKVKRLEKNMIQYYGMR